MPGDDKETIKKTYELSVDFYTSGWNNYSVIKLFQILNRCQKLNSLEKY